MKRTGRVGAERGLLALLALSPGILITRALVAMLRESPSALEDSSNILLRSYQVLSAQTPLVGQPSFASVGHEARTYSLGPIAYWLLAVPARFGSYGWVLFTTALVSMLCLSVSVLLAYRRCGLSFTCFFYVPGLLLTIRSQNARTFVEVFNPAMVLGPLVLLVLLTWSVAVKDRVLLPVVVVVASYVAQTHLMFVAPAVALGVVAFAFGYGSWVWESAVLRFRPSEPGGRPNPKDAAAAVAITGESDAALDDGRATRRIDRRGRWFAISVVAVLICWSFPLYEQLRYSPGNLVAVVRLSSTGKPTYGWGVAMQYIDRAASLLPAWTKASPTVPEALLPRGRVRAWPSVMLAIAAIIVVVSAVATSWRRRCAATGATASLAVALVVSSAWSVSVFPQDKWFVTRYTFRWLAVSGFLVTAMMLATIWELVRGANPRSRLAAWRSIGRAFPQYGRGSNPILGVGRSTAALGCVLGGLVIPLERPHSFSYPDVSQRAQFPAMRVAERAALSLTTPGRRYLVGVDDRSTLIFTHPVLRVLVVGGRLMTISPDSMSPLVDDYPPGGRRCDGLLIVSNDPGRFRGSTDEVFRAPMDGNGDLRSRVYIGLLPDQSPDGSC
jgi:hypothetical protein